MSALSAKAILSRFDATDVSRRLVVSPLLSRTEQVRVGQASIDVRLGCRFRLSDATTESMVDSLRGPTHRAPKRVLYVPLGDHLVLHPHQFVLGETLEFIRLPVDLMAYVVGRSSWGREGLVIATAVGVHPEFSGIVTLEIRNLGEIPILLYPGDLVAQLFLHDVLDPVTNPGRSQSQFSGAGGPSVGDHRYSETRQVLMALTERFHPSMSLPVHSADPDDIDADSEESARSEEADRSNRPS